MSELKMDKGMTLNLYNGPEDLMNFKITVAPDDGMYKRGVFVFDFKVPKTYPHDPPKVQCETTVFHPNIDMEGHVCLNILREDWKPVLTIQSVIMGLQVAATRLHLGLGTSAPPRCSGPAAPRPPPPDDDDDDRHPPIHSRTHIHKPHPTTAAPLPRRRRTHLHRFALTRPHPSPALLQFLMLEPNADDPLNKEVRAGAHAQGRVGKGGRCAVPGP